MKPFIRLKLDERKTKENPWLDEHSHFFGSTQYFSSIGVVPPNTPTQYLNKKETLKMAKIRYFGEVNLACLNEAVYK